MCRCLNNEWIECGTRCGNANERSVDDHREDDPVDDAKSDVESEDIVETAPCPMMGSIQYRRGEGKVITVAQMVDLVEHDEFFPTFRRYLDDIECFRELSDHQILNAAAAVYHNISIPVQHFSTGQWERQKLSSTINRNWHGKGPRNDWVWWKPKRRDGARTHPYGALHGRLPVRLYCLFSIQLYDHTLNLAFVEATTTVNGGSVDEAAGLVRVDRAIQHPFMVIDIGSIDGAAHLIPQPRIPGEPWPKSWWVNNQIDLNTWNFIYKYQEEPRDDLSDSG